MKKFAKFLLVLFFAILIGAAGVALYLKSYYDSAISTPNDGSSAQVVIEIPLGSTIRDIAEDLEKQELIADSRVFEFYVRTNNLQDKFLAGKYETKGNRTIPQVVEDLQVPIKNEVRVTIPEGLRYDEVADRLDLVLKINPNWSRDEFIALVEEPGTEFSNYEILSSKPAEASLEGFLYPDTYIFSTEATTKEIIARMIKNTQTRISGKLLSDIEDSGFSVFEVLNFASLIERESIFSVDRPKVGDVFYKRFKEGWTLGSDVTILYEKRDWKYEILQKDIDTPTPYNTRIHTGLPPTPICNPGMESIEGFVYHEPNDYYYFIGDSNGKVYYARTWTEHRNNVQKYLR